ncbi:MAG: AbrB/MazE/SpoVT family DNA-binding domain-containing protein [Acidobacteriota bacterium]|nr:AbrB/MazE/SpoVT family DNA-binding domain-containing protein [Acidobacteriota bacterium]MDP2389538.1 AbrB/MazE/SpoVT family DNA-binding domain-containing protein [Acidobacteriota bacterium]MDP3717702.1 AbrB/MazE/SpoVT family DNA-binding domain-containing protein [Acidobacteriota bacterium]
MSTIAKVTAKGQTTIPQEVRVALEIKPGDLLLWETDDKGGATVRRVEPLDLAYLRGVEGTLGEWSSQEDEAAYSDL